MCQLHTVIHVIVKSLSIKVKCIFHTAIAPVLIFQKNKSVSE